MIRRQIAKALTANGLDATGIETGGPVVDTQLRKALTQLRGKFGSGPGELDREFYIWISSFSLR